MHRLSTKQNLWKYIRWKWNQVETSFQRLVPPSTSLNRQWLRGWHLFCWQGHEWSKWSENKVRGLGPNASEHARGSPGTVSWMSQFDSCSLRLLNCLAQPRFDDEQAALNEPSTMARQPVNNFFSYLCNWQGLLILEEFDSWYCNGTEPHLPLPILLMVVLTYLVTGCNQCLRYGESVKCYLIVWKQHFHTFFS